jgi:hypothetical protein
MDARGRHIRRLGNRNRIVRVHNDDTWFLVENISVAANCTYQEAFTLLMCELSQSEQNLHASYITVLERFRTTSKQ